MGIGGAAGRLIKLRQRERRAQLEAPRLLLLRDGDGGEECFLGGRGVRWIALEQDLAADAMQESVGPVFSRLVRERQCFIDPGQAPSALPPWLRSRRASLEKGYTPLGS